MLDPAENTESTVAVRRLTDTTDHDDRVDVVVVLAVRDGVTVARRPPAEAR